jgi:thiol-disulfide isomerase/thioredoxin
MSRLERESDPGFRSLIVQSLAAEADPEVASALRLAYFTPAPPPGEEATRIARALLGTLPARSSLWRFRPEAALDAVELAGLSADTYLAELFEALDDPAVAASFFSERLRRTARAGQEEQLAAMFAVFRERFGSTPAMRAVAPYDPKHRVRPSRELPEFDLPAFGASGERITRASLRGKVTLLDFWGTWCPPCRAEMKYLERTFAKHKGEGLVVVSVAARDKPEQVRNFRAQVSPMPWQHVVLDEATEEPTLKLFEVTSFPTAVLVDREGRVVRIGEELRGDALEPAVAAELARTAR